MTLLKERVFKDFDSSAIESITFNQPIVKIVWKTSTKEYNCLLYTSPSPRD